jgi:hypothetical protein
MNLKYIFLVSISALCIRVQAQIPVNSPYSRFGIGLTDIGFNPRYAGLGNASIALPDLSGVNLSNPASFALFSETTFQKQFYFISYLGSLILEYQIHPHVNLNANRECYF